MKRCSVLVVFLCSFFTSGAETVKDLNTLRDFPKIINLEEWQQRAADIRQQVLVSCGLWPMPDKTPLNAHVFGKTERDGYTVEKVYFETYPGYILAGNLYRPVNKGTGPFPAVLNPHGHWDEGRMVDNETGSIRARCISFARQGMIAFSYDMVGYNDSKEFGDHRGFALNPTNQLWNISLMGLQTWNSIRALDFLETLPDVDKSRLACTGESGGGTQTFMLGAVDDRLALQAPIVMVSHSMQGGCLCENAPGLRVDHSNMEIAAVPAPRPQMLVGATGDWTKMTMKIEGPALESIYKLFNARDHLRYLIFNYNHNYNQTSREAVYAWFDRWLLHEPDAPSRMEEPYQKLSTKDLLVFPDGKLPHGALHSAELVNELVAMDRKQINELKPHDSESLAKWKLQMQPLWRHNLLLPEQFNSPKSSGGKNIQLQKTDGENVPVTVLNEEDGNTIVLVVSDEGIAASVDHDGAPKGLAKEFTAKGFIVAAFDPFMCGGRANKKELADRDQFKDFFTTYNRTDAQERIGEIQLVSSYLRNKYQGKKLVLAGEGKAGLWAVMAAPLADAVIADCNQVNEQSDDIYLDRNLFFPGIHRMGDFQGVLALAVPHPLLLHNAGHQMSANWIKPLYNNLEVGQKFNFSESKYSDAQLANWLGTQKI